MRYALVFLASALALALVACGRGVAAMPSVARLAADPAFAAQALPVAQELLAARRLGVEPAAEPTSADLTVAFTPAGAHAAPFAVRYWVPVAALSHPAAGLSLAQLGDAVAGRLTGWSSISGDALPLSVIVPASPAPPLAKWWPDGVSTAQVMPLEQIAGALAAAPGAIALLPLDAVDAHGRALDVDSTNAVFGPLAGYPLVETAWVTPRDASPDEFRLVLEETAAALAQRLAVSAPQPIVMRATGDIIPARCAYARQLALGDFAHAFRELGPWLAAADITVGSLDAALSDANEPFGCTETFSLMAPAATVSGLQLAGFDVVTVATNHVKDCGVSACGDRAFFDTLNNLHAAGIATSGGGAGLAEARAPALLTVRGVRFAFLGYDEIAPYYHAEPGVPGTAPLDEAYVREDVAAAKAQADVVIVQPQWGVEYMAEPTERQRLLARAAIEAGAMLVIGNHPHWVQAAEAIGGAYVSYALGNFVFDQDWSLETEQGVVLEVAFHGAQLKGVRYYPVHIYDEHQPRLAEPAEAHQILDRIWTASAALP